MNADAAEEYHARWLKRCFPRPQVLIFEGPFNECDICGACVVSMAKHANWHAGEPTRAIFGEIF